MKNLIMLVLYVCCSILAAKPVEDDFNLIKNWSFEDKISREWQNPSWIKNAIDFKVSDREAKDGRHSLEFTGAKAKKVYCIQVFFINKRSKIKNYTFSAWAKRDDTKNFASGVHAEVVYLKNGKQKFKHFNGQAGKGVDKSQWHEITGKIQLPENSTQIRIVLSSSSNTAQASSGKIYFDCVRLLEIPEASNEVGLQQLTGGGELGLYLHGEDIIFNSYIMNSYAQDKQCDLQVDAVDYYNEPVYSKNTKVLLKKLSINKIITKLPAPAKNGFFAVKFSLKTDDGKTLEYQGSFIVLDELKKRDPFFGASNFGYRLEYLGALSRLGVGTAGCLLTRGYVESKQGEYDWRKLDAKVDALKEHNFNIIGQLFFDSQKFVQPKWVRDNIKQRIKDGQHPFPPEYYAQKNKFERELVKRYKNTIHEWSFTAEIDLLILRFKYEEEHYIESAKRAYKLIKDIDKNLIVGGVGVSGVDGQSKPMFPVAEKLWGELHDYLDMFEFDPYIDPKNFGPNLEPVGPENGGLEKLLGKAISIVKKYGKNKISIGEKGYSIVASLPVDSNYSKDMGNVIARAHTIAKSFPENQYWLYFQFVSPYLEGRYNYALWKGYFPRPAAAAYATTARRLAYAHSARKIDLHSKIYCYVFKKQQASVTVLWTLTDDDVPLACNFNVPFKAYDIMNNSRSFPKGTHRLKLSKSPIFIESGSNQDAMAASLSQAQYFLPEIRIKAKLKSRSQLMLAVFNQTSSTLRTKLDLSVDGVTQRKDIELNKGLNLIPFKIPEMTVGKLNSSKIEVTAVTAARKYDQRIHLDVLPVKKIKSKVVIDGSLEEYKGIEPIVFNDATYLMPIDALSNRLWKGPSDLSAKIYFAYDDENLYFSAEVIDDYYKNTQTGFWIWANDSFQLAVDTQNDAYGPEFTKSTGYDANDYEYGIALGCKGPEVFCFTTAVVNPEIRKKNVPFKIAVKKVSKDKFIYEVAIPKKYLRPLIIKNGNAFGMSFVLHDRDKEDKYTRYRMQLSPGIVNGKKPDAFKTFMFTE